MTITAYTGPLLTFGLTRSASGGVQEYNEQRGPSLMDVGSGVLDPRSQFTYIPGNSPSQVVYGFWDNMGMVDQVPTTISSNNIATTQVPVSGTALTLTAGATAGSSGISVVSITAPENGQTVTGLRCIDTAMTPLTFGSAGTIGIWDPSKSVARCIRITGSSQNDGGINWTIAGRDVYGFKVTEVIAGSTSGSTGSVVTYTSQKAYKYISAITPVNSTGTIGSTNVIVGTADVYGFPWRVDSAVYGTVYYGASSAPTLSAWSSQGTFASSVTATSTTADVRGTYTASAASNSTAAAVVRLQMMVNASPVNLATLSSTNHTAYFGFPQYSSV